MTACPADKVNRCSSPSIVRSCANWVGPAEVVIDFWILMRSPTSSIARASWSSAAVPGNSVPKKLKRASGSGLMRYSASVRAAASLWTSESVID